ncbi:MAG: TSUP family transporter [Clostridia bacterium]|nr:TSUP family transporter [Clostridia bacterium]
MIEEKRLPAWLGALILALSSFLAGGLNGLLGTGGGMVLVFVLGALLGRGRGKEVFVLSSFGILVFSLVSAAMYGTGGSLDAAALPRFALPAAAGGIVGAFLLDKIKLFWVKKLFAVILLYSGLKMVGVV